MIDNRADEFSLANSPLPDFAIQWQVPGLQRLSVSLPAHLDDRVAPEALFYIPPSEEGSSTSSGQYITRHPCSFCRLKRKVWCDRAYPTCSMCEKLGRICIPFKTEWMPVPPKQGPGSRSSNKEQHTIARRREEADRTRPRPSYQQFLYPALPVHNAPESAVAVKIPRKPRRSKAVNVKGQDPTGLAENAVASGPPLVSSKAPSPPPSSDVTPLILTPNSPPVALVAVEPADPEAHENGVPLMIVDHDLPSEPLQEEPFRWKPLSTPWTPMYRDYQSRSFLEALASGSATNLAAGIEERMSRTVAWSDTLEELHEAIPFLHDLDHGYQLSSVGLLEALVLAGPAKPGDRCVNDVLWFTLTFRSELKKPKAPTTREPSASDYPIDPIIDALRLNHRWGVPFALIADEQFGALPFALGAPYTVLGWYHVCGVGEPTHTFNATSKRPSVESSWTFCFRPAQSKAEPGGSSNADGGTGLSSGNAPMVDSPRSNGHGNGEPTLNWPPLRVQQTEDIVMEPASTGGVLVEHQAHEASAAPTPTERPSLDGPLVESVFAMRIRENIQPESSRTEAMEVDPVSDAFELISGNFALRGGQRDVADSPAKMHLGQQVIGRERQPELLEGDWPFSLGLYRRPYPLPSQAEMYAEYANAVIKVDGPAQENPTSASASNPLISPTAGPSQSTAQTLTENQETFGSSRRVLDRPVSLVPQPQPPVPAAPADEPVSTPLQSRPAHSKEQAGTQTARSGSIKSRLMARVADWTTLRKPTLEEFVFKNPVVDAPVPPPTLEEQPQQMQDIESEAQASLPDPDDVDGEPLVMAEEAVSPPPVPQPPPGNEDLATVATTPPPAEPSDPVVNASSSKRSQLKVTGSTRKDKSRVKNERPNVRPAIPQDLPEFPHLGPPPNADSPISPEELGLSFERRKLDADSTTQWDIIAAKLDGFICTRCRKANARRFWSSLRCNYCQHRVELSRPKWTWHTLTLGDSAVMPKDAREDADYYKGFTMNRVLWDDGVEAVTYVGEDDKGLKIIHVRTTRSALRDPLENLIADSAELDLIRPRFAQGKGAGTLAPYFAHVVGEGTLEVHPELEPVPFDKAYDKGSVLEKVDEFMGQCAAHSCLSTETEPFDQQILLLGGADAPAITEAFSKDNMIAFTVVGATCDLTVKSVNNWKGNKGRKEHDFFSHIDMLHGDFVCIMSPAPLKYSLERKGFGLVVMGRWVNTKPVEGD